MKQLHQRLAMAGFLLCSAGTGPATAPSPDRSFLFTNGGVLSGLPPGKRVQVWMPVPLSGEFQTVQPVSRILPAGANAQVHAARDNHIFYFDAVAGHDGKVSFSATYRVERRIAGEDSHKETAADAQYLQPDTLVPIGGKPATLIAGRKLPDDGLARARVLYDLVDDHMVYRKDQPGWGRGDAAWACDSKFGNCTDFHSLFLSLARTTALPARFEMGVSIPPGKTSGDITGYHCWAFFKPPGHGWVPVDISEANKNPSRRDFYFGHLDADRVALSRGRDLMLEPKQSGPPLNFFVFPYAEVDGQPLPSEQIKPLFSFTSTVSSTQPESK